MNEKINALWDDGIENRLESTLNGTYENDPSYKEITESIKLKLEFEKMRLDDVRKKKELEIREKEVENNLLKIELDSTLKEKEISEKRKESIRNSWVKGIELCAIVVIAPVITGGINYGFAKMMGEFEKNYTWTTTPGRALSQLFKFRK